MPVQEACQVGGAGVKPGALTRHTTTTCPNIAHTRHELNPPCPTRHADQPGAMSSGHAAPGRDDRPGRRRGGRAMTIA